MAALAEQGNVAAADQFCKIQSGWYHAKGKSRLEDEDDGLLQDTPYVVNILVPHPELPNGGRLPSPPRLGADVPPLRDIPTVALK